MQGALGGVDDGMSRNEYGSEAALGQGLQAGDPEAARVFVERFLPRIRNTLRKVMYAADGYEPSDLEDVALDVVHSVVSKCSGTQPRTNLRGYVETATLRAGLDWRKSNRRRFETESDVQAVDVSHDGVHTDVRAGGDFHPHPAIALQPEVVSVLTDAQQVLKPEHRQLLDLRAQGYEYDEIDILLGDPDQPIKEATWRQRHKRALDRYRAECERLVSDHPELKTLLREAEKRAYAQSVKSSAKGNA